MTNEDIFKIFLKKYRKFSYCKRNFKLGFDGWAYENTLEYINENIVGVKRAVNCLFIWEQTDEGHEYWYEKEMEWDKLCKEFNLSGNINLNEVFK